MTIDKGIPIKNIFYMLTYAFKELNREYYKRVETEDLATYMICLPRFSTWVFRIC